MAIQAALFFSFLLLLISISQASPVSLPDTHKNVPRIWGTSASDWKKLGKDIEKVAKDTGNGIKEVAKDTGNFFKDVGTTAKEVGGSSMDAIVDIFDPNNPPKGLSIPCNGSPFLCSRKYGNITHIGAHNSFGATDNPLELSANQKWDVTKQLDAGVRLLQGQVHLDGGKMKLCHSYCMDPIFYDAGPVVNYLKKVKKWLDANPGQVVTILFGNPDRHKGADLETQWHPQFVNSGLEPLIYRPPPEVVYREDWPTLQEILDQGKRLIVFLSYGANRTRVDYLLPEFDHMWETPFTITEKKRLKECELDRPSSIGTNGSMYLMHHSLNYRFMGTPGVVPTRYGAKEINTFNSILEHSQACAKMANRWPNFILMDFIDVGEPFKAMRYFNNV